jgi:hypothetical protein
MIDMAYIRVRRFKTPKPARYNSTKACKIPYRFKAPKGSGVMVGPKTVKHEAKMHASKPGELERSMLME